ncbi:MAG: MFS transporter [Candidatus Promineifilaceae bacterium]
MNHREVSGWVMYDWANSAFATTVVITLLGWMAVLIYAFGWLRTPAQVWGWAAAEALFLGSSQALSRSLFAKMVPAQQESVYFSLYEVSERGTSWLGPLVFGLAVQLTGSPRSALLPLILFFAVGCALLLTTDVRQGIRDAGNELPALV